jgi:hypothetical protein
MIFNVKTPQATRHLAKNSRDQGINKSNSISQSWPKVEKKQILHKLNFSGVLL